MDATSQSTEELLVMELQLVTDQVRFMVSMPPEPKVDRETGAQRFDRATALPLWLVQLVAKDAKGSEVISVTVAAQEPPKVSPDDVVTVTRLVAIPWVSGDRARIAYRAESIARVASAKAA
jgi:hypothetical protein